MPFDNPVQVPIKITPITILDDMLQRLATPDDWCQRIYYRTKPNGRTQMCLMAALFVADQGGSINHDQEWKTFRTEAAVKVFNRLEKNAKNMSSSGTGAMGFNDSSFTKHADIVALLMRTRADFAPYWLTTMLRRFCRLT